MESKSYYKESQDAFIRHHGLTVGSTIKILRKARDYEVGWGYPWTGCMDKLVGQELVVTKIDSNVGIGFKTGAGVLYVPYTVVEVTTSKSIIKDITTAGLEARIVPEGDVVIGGSHLVKFEKLRELYEAAKSVKK